MSFREYYEALEKKILSPYATLSSQTKGRQRPMTPCRLRTAFQRDRDRIIHCKSFRRLKHKTQVFLSPEGDHYRTRLTHTLEVSQIARTIARALRLNEDLTEAVALGHDIGHTPFGHAGERVLDRIAGGFAHNIQSLRVVEFLENGTGLNLTHEVRDGIKNHKKGNKPETLEGSVVNLSDRIAYINHDIDDAVRAGIISLEDLPEECIGVLGRTHGERINTMILDVVAQSQDSPKLYMASDVEKAMETLRDFMFERVYLHSAAKSEEGKAERIIEILYRSFCDKPELMPPYCMENIKKYGRKQVVVDYIAGMTDRYTLKVFETLFIPQGWYKY